MLFRKEIVESLTIKFAESAARRKQQGLPIVSLGLGEPEFETPHEIIHTAAEQGKAVGLKHVYAHTDISCDCASENATVDDWLGKTGKEVQQKNVCSASCCGSEGILVKKFEKEAGLLE